MRGLIRKFWFLTLLFLLLSTCGNLHFLRSSSSASGVFRIGTMNTLHLGWGKKNFHLLASALTNLSLIGLVEVMKESGISNLAVELSKQTGTSWSYAISPKKTGRGRYKEYCGFVWKNSQVVYLESQGFYPEREDSDFSREPYAADFRIGNFDFTFVLLHVVFGSSKHERESEVRLLPEVYRYYQQKNGSEQDVVIGGDFNLPVKNKAFRGLLFYCDSARDVLPLGTKTTIGKHGFVSAYDHLFLTRFTREFDGKSGVINFTRGRYAWMRKRVSDHLPIYFEVRMMPDDD